MEKEAKRTVTAEEVEVRKFFSFWKEHGFEDPLVSEERYAFDKEYRSAVDEVAPRAVKLYEQNSKSSGWKGGKVYERDTDASIFLVTVKCELGKALRKKKKAGSGAVAGELLRERYRKIEEEPER